MSAPSSTEPLIHPMRRTFLRPIARLYATNPFEPAWEDLQKTARGHNYVPADAVPATGNPALTKNLEALTETIATAVAVSGYQLGQGIAGTAEEPALHQGAAIYYLWTEYGPQLQRLIDQDQVDVPFYDAFVETHRLLFDHPGLMVPDPPHLLGLYYQARRAWYFPATKILGASPSAAAARASIWRANMGADICAYADGLYRRMDEIPVLITGETGTGKDLAAQCVGWSRYIPFDPVTRRFAGRYAENAT